MIRLSVYLVAALVSTIGALPQQTAPEARISLCPDLFRYTSLDQGGQWTGNLLVQSKDELHGVWIRLIFDNPFTEINVDSDYELGPKSVENEVVIKRKDLLLKAESPTNVKITVKYADNKFPQIIAYRLNGITMCPHPDRTRVDFFQGDEHSNDLLTEKLSPITPIDQSAYACGIKPLEPNTGTSQLPWAADLYIKNKGTETYVCEATLISPTHLVTAAHCVTFKNDRDKIPVSKLEVSLVEGSEAIRIRKVSKIHVHAAYDPNTLFNDIAVIEIDEALEITDNIRPICLGGASISEDKLKLIGYEVEGNGKLSSNQVEADVKKIRAKECKQIAPKLENILAAGSYCVTYVPGNRLCAGDSGSSIVSYKDNVATLRGIVKVGVLLQNQTRCEDNSVVLVTNVEKYLKWISDILRS